jgi:hypothetical protein
MFAANTDFQLRLHRAAALDADLHQFTDALLVDRDERIARLAAAQAALGKAVASQA